jgi:hypothetical protein
MATCWVASTIRSCMHLHAPTVKEHAQSALGNMSIQQHEKAEDISIEPQCMSSIDRTRRWGPRVMGSRPNHEGSTNGTDWGNRGVHMWYTSCSLLQSLRFLDRPLSLRCSTRGILDTGCRKLHRSSYTCVLQHGSTKATCRAHGPPTCNKKVAKTTATPASESAHTDTNLTCGVHLWYQPIDHIERASSGIRCVC